jgi:hypothetical protein
VSFDRLLQDKHSDSEITQGHHVPQIDLLSRFQIRSGWLPTFSREGEHWKILSGKWRLMPSHKVICSKEERPKLGESIAVVGSSRWDDFTFQVTFRLLTQSIKPPEGGVILFYLLKNVKNYYSCHICVYKKKIEFIKRVRGIWTLIAEANFDVKTQREYRAVICTERGKHQCFIDGKKQMEVYDRDISRGRVGIGAKYCDVEFSHGSVLIPPPDPT